MGTYFNGNLSNKGDRLTINIRIQIVEFKEDNIYFVYSPHLEITGYGTTKKEAKNSFEICLEEFFEYTINKNTIKEVLKSLGWKVGTSRKIKNPKPPSYSYLVKNNEYLSNILDNNSVSSTQRNIAIPA